ncbi:DUF6443 domain-containing protein [Aquimarina litoralis]|uniref:DUF6443 domain-containing protein n=1 Tax=Aquimarina litoralis TaxID=584605 RepID=UPI001C59B861|nr:DUF6443 domain-containing protein [Aquimarina litoralis]MBW1298505.1 hypothetical protein [Aquimarina litoralis]
MQNKLYILVVLWFMGYTVQAQLTDEPIDGTPGTRYYFDSDKDGYGDPNSNWLSSPASGYVPNNVDCNDNDKTIFPGAPELCDGKDNDCDGSVDEAPKPGTPSAPTSITVNCGNTKITRSNPPGGITWYWQSSASGTSTGNSSSVYTAYNGSRVYLRGRNNSTGCWGSSRTITYSMKYNPATPAMPTIDKNCGNTKLTRGNPPSGITWYWQTIPSGISTSNSSTTYTATSGTRVYLKARNNSTGCWSAARYVDYTINAIPPIPSAPSITQSCGSTRLTRSNPPSGITWYWQSSASGTSTSNISASVTRTSGSVYYLRARNNSTGCWSPARTVNYSINSNPAIPSAPTVSNDCGHANITKSASPSGITWYWQYSVDGIDTSNTSTTITLDKGDTYYLRARNNSTGCWSSARTISYTIYTIPDVPAAPTVDNNCGNSLLTRGNPPSGITWYWQRSDSGFDATDSSTSVTRTEGSIYYLRARNNSTGCWSTSSRAISYSIKTIPDIPSMPVITNNCSNTTITRGNPPTGITWYWQNSISGTSTANSSAIVTKTNGSVDYLRARNNSTGCWSTALTINYTIDFPVTWYADIDGDGYGDPNTSVEACTPPAGYVLNSQDQCPNDATAFKGCAPVIGSLDLSNENYVFSRSFQRALSSATEIQESADVLENVTYFDGLGRAKQQVAIQASPNYKDIITHLVYDDLGRQEKTYLPFERNTTSGSYEAVTISSDINSYYKATYPNDFTGVTATSSEFNAYAEAVLENSPLNRTLEQGAPGKDWKADRSSDTDHTIKFDWGTNTTDEVVRFDVTFLYNDTERPQLVKNDNPYTAEELYVTITKDENWTPADGNNHTTKEYKDKLGRVVLKRAFNSSSPSSGGSTEGDGGEHDTYYVYDRFGNLTFVIPPKVTVADGVSDEELSELCYQYKYDVRNRVVEKKIPGKGWEYIVYNKLDQPVLTQDANLRKVNTGKTFDYWLFTKYDAHGRVAYTGKLINNSSRKILQGRTYSSSFKQYERKSSAPITVYGVDAYYTKEAYPTSIQNIYTINYYDTYDFDIEGLSNPGTVYGQSVSDRTRSLPTGSKVRVLDTNEWITTVTYYDQKGRPIYVASKNEYLKTLDIVETQLDFAGKVLATKTTHTKDGHTPIVTIDRFTYDHMGRLLSQVQKINEQQEELIVANAYDALGQLTRKKVGGTVSSDEVTASAGLQTVDYSYNVRGWLAKINDPDVIGNDLFAFKIAYNTGMNPLYNGNISQTSWKTANDNTKRWYDYEYDALNRITGATSNDNRYNLSGVTYDKMGNIESLTRNGFQNTSSYTHMDILSYDYDSGNKLRKVTDGGNDDYGFKDGTNTNDDYVYDINGNMILDRNKGITDIQYNHLNLPTKVTIDNGQTSGDIDYIYDATGAKLKKIVAEGSSLTQTEYAGNYVYKNNTLEFFNHAEGIVEKEANGYKYVYQFKDHLDNIRLSYKDANKDGSITQDEIVQEKNYYPFGLTHNGYNEVLRGRDHTYGFTNKEEQDEIGLGWIDITARNYDAALGRWMNLDPLAEEMRRHSPYNYSFDNPVYFMDPDGMAPTDWFKNKSGNSIVWFDNQSESFSNDSGEWTNVGANLQEVASTLDLPSGTAEFSDTSFIMIGAGRGAYGGIGEGFLGLPAPVRLNVALNVSSSFELDNAGDSGMERIDGQTEITGVNITTDISVSTSAPGVNLMGIGGDTSFGSKWTPSGKQPTYSSNINMANPEKVGSSHESTISGSSTINLGLNNVSRRTRNYSESFNFDLNVDAVVPIRLDQNGQSKVLNFSFEN